MDTLSIGQLAKKLKENNAVLYNGTMYRMLFKGDALALQIRQRYYDIGQWHTLKHFYGFVLDDCRDAAAIILKREKGEL